MPVVREKLPGEPIVIIKLSEDLDLAVEAGGSMQADIAFIESLGEPVHLILDLSAHHIDLSRLILGTNMSARGENPLLHHSNIISVTYVTPSSLMAVAAKGLDSEAFGNLKVKVFGTLDEALAHARAFA